MTLISSHAGPSRIRPSIFLPLLLLTALAIRLDFLVASRFVIDSDEAIVGLMAKHILEGGPIPAFYYGQSYMGSFEALCAAGVFAAIGISSFALKLVPLFFSLVFVALVYFITRELAGELAGRAAGLFIACPPITLVEWSSRARGGFIELIVIGTLALYLLLRGLRAGSLRPRRVIAAGLLLGFGWWVNNQIIYFMLPCAAAIAGAALYERPIGSARDLWKGFGRVLRAAFLTLAAFVAGGLPYWIYNLNHDFVSLGMFGHAKRRETLEHLEGVVTQALPIILGAER
jgi:predicted membrane-bound mannosyltransferase